MKTTDRRDGIFILVELGLLIEIWYQFGENELTLSCLMSPAFTWAGSVSSVLPFTRAVQRWDSVLTLFRDRLQAQFIIDTSRKLFTEPAIGRFRWQEMCVFTVLYKYLQKMVKLPADASLFVFP